jgi:hypothetical protein
VALEPLSGAKRVEIAAHFADGRKILEN